MCVTDQFHIPIWFETYPNTLHHVVISSIVCSPGKCETGYCYIGSSVQKIVVVCNDTVLHSVLSYGEAIKLLFLIELLRVVVVA